MTPAEFRTFGHQLVDLIADYRETVAARPVRAATNPGDTRALIPAAPPLGRRRGARSALGCGAAPGRSTGAPT